MKKRGKKGVMSTKGKILEMTDGKYTAREQAPDK